MKFLRYKSCRSINVYILIEMYIFFVSDRVFEIEDWNDIFTLQANIWEIPSKWILEIEK